MNLYSELQLKAMLIAQRELCANTYLRNQKEPPEEIVMKIMNTENPKIEMPTVNLTNLLRKL